VRARPVLAVLVAVGSLLVAGAAPASAAPTRTVIGIHVSVSEVGGALHRGARLSHIQTCPRGTDLDVRSTRILGEAHDRRLQVVSREYWPAGIVTRYRVRSSFSKRSGLLGSAVVCRSKVAPGTSTVSGRAKSDLRVWGPAPARVVLVNSVVVAVTDNLLSTYSYRDSLHAAGIDAHPTSLRGAVVAVQRLFSDPMGEVLVAVGETKRKVARGQFASMRNNYRYVAHLDERSP
jgi:hypothetical protein